MICQVVGPPAEPVAPVTGAFPEDEPLFAEASTEPLHEHHDPHEEAEHQEWEREHELQERMNLAAAFRGEAPASPLRIPEAEPVAEETHSPHNTLADSAAMSAGTVEEEEIEEDEADLSAYVEELEEDEAF